MPRVATGRRARKRSNTRAKDSKLSKELICATALKLIDRKGLTQFSLRDVARSLGVYPRAVYWYVANRNELLSEVVGFALREVYLPPSNQSWQEWLRNLFHHYRDVVRLHPNIAPLIGASMLSPGALVPETIERILTVLSEAGFPDDQLADVYNVVIAAQVGFVTLELATLPSDDTETWSKDQKTRIGTIDVLRYPMLGRHLPALANRAFILRWTNGTEVPLDSSFGKFVDVIIRGLEQLLPANRGKR